MSSAAGRSRFGEFLECMRHAAKARGAVLGGPKLPEARKVAEVAIRAHADQHTANLLPIIREAQCARATSLREIAEVLNSHGISTARGGLWYATSVKDMLDRASQGPLP
jgi:Recombinase